MRVFLHDPAALRHRVGFLWVLDEEKVIVSSSLQEVVSVYD